MVEGPPKAQTAPLALAAEIGYMQGKGGGDEAEIGYMAPGQRGGEPTGSADHGPRRRGARERRQWWREPHMEIGYMEGRARVARGWHRWRPNTCAGLAQPPCRFHG